MHLLLFAVDAATVVNATAVDDVAVVASTTDCIVGMNSLIGGILTELNSFD